MKRNTVNLFLVVLCSAIVQADASQARRDAKRGIPVNIYALGLCLEAKERVEADLADIPDEQRNDKEAVLAFRAAVERRFTDVPFRRAVLRKVDKWLADGKPPTLPKGVKPCWS